jgi:Fur family zinc uptake transcriptional regulator
LQDGHDWLALRSHAVAVLAAQGSGLTPLREAVLAELFAAGKPLGAYDLADNLNRRSGGNVAINSVYRILARCLEVGLVRRVESRHAYIVVHYDEVDAAMFLLCDQCGSATPVVAPEVEAVLADRAAASGFQPTTHGVEVAGICRDCRPGNQLASK